MSERRAAYRAGGAMRYLEFFVAGKPRAKQSFRYTENGGGYTDPGVKAWQQEVSKAAREAMRGRDLFKGPVSVVLKFYLPTKRRVDADNLSKCVLDGLNGVAFADDAQVDDLHIVKIIDRKDPGVTICILEDEEA